MKKTLAYLTIILLIISCDNSNNSDKYYIVNKNKDEKTEKLVIDVGLKEKINKGELKKLV